MISNSENQIVNVLIRIVVKKYKKEEFLESMHMYKAETCKQPGCLSLDIYMDTVNEDTYRLVGEWESAQALEKHYKTREFELLIGASKVLCDTFEIETTEVLNGGSLDWAQRQIRSSKNIRENIID